MNQKNEQEVREKTLQYFDGDELATNVWMSKYALRDLDGNYLEQTPADMHERLAKEFARIEQKYPNPMSEEEILGLFANFKQIVPQGSPMSTVGNPFYLQTVGNCYVIDPPEDSYGGILKTDQQLVQIAKRRGGIGFDISKIRPHGQPTKNAARTTDGIGVFMERFSNSCREVAQNGRRGALMLTISVHHPDIHTFVNIKRDLRKVTGANISIRVSDEFMNAVDNDTEFELRFPVDSETPKVRKMVSAKELWDEIVDSAHQSAEPGILFWDNVITNTPSDAYEEFRTTSTNPCVIGETLIAVADGRNAVKIQDLAEQGADVPVYSTDTESGQVQIKMARNPRKTGEKAEVCKLTLDDGSSLIATPGHKVLLKNGTYTEIRDLQFGDSIFPFNSFNSNNYRQISQTGKKMTGGICRNRRQYRLIHEFYKGQVDPKTYAIHHRDYNSFNDNIDNLETMLHEDHRELHARLMRGKNNPYHRMTDIWKFKFASHPGESNPKFTGHSNEQILEAARDLYLKEGKFSVRSWQKYAKKNGYPQTISNKFRFENWDNFRNLVINNHKVVSVESAGYRDVYNLTVDDNNNYHVITSHKDENFTNSSGICIKNCGEIAMGTDSCRLMLVNTFGFVNNAFTPNPSFQWKKFGQVVQKAQRLMDDIIDIEVECIDRILAKIKRDPESQESKQTEIDLWQTFRDNCIRARRTGLGQTGLGDTLAALGIQYGSGDSIKFVEKLYKTIAINAYKASCMLAKERGAFPAFSFDKERSNPFIERVINSDDELKDLYYKHGRRNIALTTTAPAGSVSILTQTTSGIEPAFLLEYKRRRKLDSTEPDSVVDYVDDLGDRWQEYDVYHHNYRKWMTVSGKSGIENSPYHKATSNDINWEASVDLQAAAQKWVCHAISKTCNLPAEATQELVSDVYFRAWKAGCKGFTIYRDGSRAGVLLANEREEVTTFPQHSAPKRPEALECDIHHTTIQGERWIILIGLMDNKPYEVFGGLSNLVEIPKKYVAGRIEKTSYKSRNGRYDLVFGNNGDSGAVRDIVNVFDNPNHSATTRLISLSLRHGASIKYTVEQLLKDKNSDMFSFVRCISRVLKQYIEDGECSSDKTCESCNAEDTLIYMEGCVTCKSCGFSKCG